jgi:hypothetical protein
VDGIIATLVLFPVLDTCPVFLPPATITMFPTSDLMKSTILLVSQVNLDGVIGLDEKVQVADRVPVKSVRNALLPKLNRSNFAELEPQHNRMYHLNH